MNRLVRQALLASRPRVQVPEFSLSSELGSDLLLYWDARRTDLMIQGSPVTRITTFDDIVAGYRVTQATGTAQPTYNATLRRLEFDGTDDRWAATTGAVMAALPAGATTFDMLFIGSQDNPTFLANNWITSWGTSSNNSFLCGKASLAASHRFRTAIGQGASSVNLDLQGVAAGDMYLYVAAGGLTYRFDVLRALTTELANPAQAITNPPVRFTIGSRFITTFQDQFWLGSMRALAIMRPQHDVMRTRIRNWATQRLLQGT